MRRALALASLGLAAALAAASPASADWLVMKDGSGRLQTKGTWEVRGAMVVFTRPNGTLSSVRTADIDLDASKKATEEAATTKPAATTAPATPAAATATTDATKPVVTITDKDVAHVDPVKIAAEQAAAKTAADVAKGTTPAPNGGNTPVAKAPDRLSVTAWRQDLEASKGGVVIVGELSNASNEVVGNIVVTVSLFDDKGKLLATAESLLGANVLQPAQHTSLRASFPGVYNFADAKFETKSLALKSTTPG